MSPKKIKSCFPQISVPETDSDSESESECVSPRTVIPSPRSKEVKSPENVDNAVVSSERSENTAENVSEKDQEDSLSSDEIPLSDDDRREMPKKSVTIDDSDEVIKEEEDDDDDDQSSSERSENTAENVSEKDQEDSLSSDEIRPSDDDRRENCKISVRIDNSDDEVTKEEDDRSSMIPSPKVKELKSPENVDNAVVSSERSVNPAEKVFEKDQEDSLSSDEISVRIEYSDDDEVTKEEEDDQSSKVLAHLKPSPSVHVKESHHQQQTTNSEISIVRTGKEAWRLVNEEQHMSTKSITWSSSVSGSSERSENPAENVSSKEKLEGDIVGKKFHLLSRCSFVSGSPSDDDSEISPSDDDSEISPSDDDDKRPVNVTEPKSSIMDMYFEEKCGKIQFNSVARSFLNAKPTNPLEVYDIVESILKIRLKAAFEEDLCKVVPMLQSFVKVFGFWEEVIKSEDFLRFVATEYLGKNWSAKELVTGYQREAAFELLRSYGFFMNAQRAFFSTKFYGTTTFGALWVRSCSCIATYQDSIICGFTDGSLVQFKVSDRRLLDSGKLIAPYTTGKSRVIGLFYGAKKKIIYAQRDGLIFHLNLITEVRRLLYTGDGEQMIDFDGNHRGWVALYHTGYKVWNALGEVIYMDGEKFFDIPKLWVCQNKFLICTLRAIVCYSLINPGVEIHKTKAKRLFLSNTFDANEKFFVVMEGKKLKVTHKNVTVVSIPDLSVVQQIQDIGDLVALNTHSLLAYVKGNITMFGLREYKKMTMKPPISRTLANIRALKADDRRLIAVSDEQIYLWEM